MLASSSTLISPAPEAYGTGRFRAHVSLLALAYCCQRCCLLFFAYAWVFMTVSLDFVEPVRIERTTARISGECSNQLSYGSNVTEMASQLRSRHGGNKYYIWLSLARTHFLSRTASFLRFHGVTSDGFSHHFDPIKPGPKHALNKRDQIIHVVVSSMDFCSTDLTVCVASRRRHACS